MKLHFNGYSLNRAVIAVDQDELGIQGRRVATRNQIEVWQRPITPVAKNGHHSYAVAFVSRRDDGAPYRTNFTIKELGLKNPNGYTVQDLYDSSRNVGVFRSGSEFVTRVNPNGNACYRPVVVQLLIVYLIPNLRRNFLQVYCAVNRNYANEPAPAQPSLRIRSFILFLNDFNFNKS